MINNFLAFIIIIFTCYLICIIFRHWLSLTIHKRNTIFHADTELLAGNKCVLDRVNCLLFLKFISIIIVIRFLETK